MIVQIDSEKFREKIQQAKDWNEDDDWCWNAALESAERIFRELSDSSESVDKSTDLGSTETYVYCGGLKDPFGDKDETMFPTDHLIRIEKTDFGYNRELLICSKKLPNCDAVKYHLTYLGKRTSISL